MGVCLGAREASFHLLIWSGVFYFTLLYPDKHCSKFPSWGSQSLPGGENRISACVTYLIHSAYICVPSCGPVLPEVGVFLQESQICVILFFSQSWMTTCLCEWVCYYSCSRWICFCCIIWPDLHRWSKRSWIFWCLMTLWHQPYVMHGSKPGWCVIMVPFEDFSSLNHKNTDWFLCHLIGFIWFCYLKMLPIGCVNCSDKYVHLCFIFSGDLLWQHACMYLLVPHTVFIKLIYAFDWRNGPFLCRCWLIWFMQVVNLLLLLALVLIRVVV